MTPMSVSGVDVRFARAEDVETIALFNEAMALETEDIRLVPATIRRGVAAVIEDASRGRYLLAERNEEVAGCLLLTYEWSDWRNATFLWIQSVYVAPAHRRHGVFTALFRRVEEIASAPGHCGLRLYMDSGNASARKTYERLGLEHRSYLVFESPDRLRGE
jgi:GNAT superfamily N-acetyltransferase